MTTEWWNGPVPLNKFAYKHKVPLYVAKDGSADFVKRMTEYVLNIEENIIAKEHLVSEVPKNDSMDPYQHTQQWKQHNLLNDVPGKDGEHLERFPKDPVIEELFNLLRTNYLTHLANLNYPRIKVWVHGWANVLRHDQWISRHNHMSHENAYLAATYYLTTNNTNLYMANPVNPKDEIAIKTEARKLVIFPSWLQHWSDACISEPTRISLAFDIVTEETVLQNPWRPHRLLDDPESMPGLDGK